MPLLHELDDEAYERAHNQRVDLIQDLCADGFERWDMCQNGDERFMAMRGGKETIKTVKYDPDTASYKIV